MKAVVQASALGATCLALHLSSSVDQVQGFMILSGRTNARVASSSSRGRDLLPFRRGQQSCCSTCRMVAGEGDDSKAKGFGVPVPPTQGKNSKKGKGKSPGGALFPPPEEDGSSDNRKLLLQFQCNKCEKYSQYMIGKVAYEDGIVICTCKGCGVRHLISDNLKKMDFPEFGNNIEEFMSAKGSPEEVKRGTAPNFSPELLDKYDLSVGDDGLLVLSPKTEEGESPVSS